MSGSESYDGGRRRGPRGSEGGSIWFNRKSTAFQQRLEKLEKRQRAVEDRYDKQKSDNDRNLLEFADLSNKTRRLYLRLTRLTKIEQEESSDKVDDDNGAITATSSREIREQIERGLG